MKFRLIESLEVLVQNDIRSASYLRSVNPDKVRSVNWIASGTPRKNRPASLVEIPTFLTHNTVFQIQQINKDFAVLRVVSSPILIGSRNPFGYKIVISIPELLKLNFRQE
jgi:hypothetical protein